MSRIGVPGVSGEYTEPTSYPIGIPNPQGDYCPNCDWPTDMYDPVGISGRNTVFHFTCEHCGWSLSAPQFVSENRTPRP